MNEASKTMATFSETQLKEIFSGSGIDIGCGADICMPHFEAFDKTQGDANNILQYRGTRQYHCVASFHCLEHLWNPYKSIQDFWKLVKPDGYMVIAVPDEDLYEQGVFPSRFNRDHKWTFTIQKESSWCSRSVNVKDLIKLLDNCEVLKCQVQDAGYNYQFKQVDQTLRDAMAQIILVAHKVCTDDTSSQG